MEWLFGRKMTPDEMLRKNQRALTKAMRDLDRERTKMEQQEKKTIADIKKMAKLGQMDAVRIMAKVNLILLYSIASFILTNFHLPKYCHYFVLQISKLEYGPIVIAQIYCN